MATNRADTGNHAVIVHAGKPGDRTFVEEHRLSVPWTIVEWVTLQRDDLKRLAGVMYLACGQMTDPSGSQGEQIQHTNFAQHGDMSNVFRLRGGYSESWTVFWITAHFLDAAAESERMGVDLDQVEMSMAQAIGKGDGRGS